MMSLVGSSSNLIGSFQRLDIVLGLIDDGEVEPPMTDHTVHLPTF